MNIIKNVGRILLGSMLLLSMMSCHNEVAPSGRPQKPLKNIDLTRTEQEIVNSHTKFAFDLFHKMNEQEDADSYKTENMIISPLSLSLDLSMFANAVDDDNYSKILELMNLSPTTTREELNNLSRMLVDELLNIDSQVIMKVSNSIWTKPGYGVKQSFADEVMKQYNAPCTPVAFWEKESEDIINGWVKEATDGLIREVHKASPNNVLTLFQFYNALYFNGEWVYQFNKDKTVKKDFKNLDGSNVNVPMMHGETDVINLHDDDRSIIGLPFGNSAYRMFFILPDRGKDFKRNIAEFDYEKWSDYKDLFFYSDVTMSVPRVELDCNVEMTDALAGMGLDFNGTDGVPVGNMFEDEITADKIKVSQACYFKIEEVGVKAAAVTQISGDFAAAEPIKKFEIDRPFMFLIEEQSTGTILFIGKVVKL